MFVAVNPTGHRSYTDLYFFTVMLLLLCKFSLCRIVKASSNVISFVTTNLTIIHLMFAYINMYIYFDRNMAQKCKILFSTQGHRATCTDPRCVVL